MLSQRRQRQREPRRGYPCRAPCRATPSRLRQGEHAGSGRASSSQKPAQEKQEKNKKQRMHTSRRVNRRASTVPTTRRGARARRTRNIPARRRARLGLGRGRPRLCPNRVHAQERGGAVWADPDDPRDPAVAQRLRSLQARIKYKIDAATGRPENPYGRTGMSGPASWASGVPNFCGDPIVTRINPATGRAEMVAIERGDQRGTWAIPGGFIENQDEAKRVDNGKARV